MFDDAITMHLLDVTLIFLDLVLDLGFLEKAKLAIRYRTNK